jgi:hypothetical protein
MFRSGSESPLRGLPGVRRPSIARQASVAVMETSPAPALPSPVPRPAVSRNNTALVTTGATVVSGSRNRSMSRGEHTDGFTSPYPLPPPTPTSGMPPSGRYGATTPHLQPTGGSLKDVLKMAPMPAAGQNDLLPPSPSVHSSTVNRFNFLPLPSPLSHSHSQSNLHAAAHASPGGGASPSSYGHAGQAYFAGNRPASPPMGSLQQQQQQQQHRRQPSQEATTTTTMGLSYDGQPPLRPLDYNRLATANDVHHELERTAIDLGRWLDLIDVGLGSLLYDLPPEADDGAVH